MAINVVHSPGATFQAMLEYLAGAGAQGRRNRAIEQQARAQLRTQANQAIFGGLGQGITQGIVSPIEQRDALARINAQQEGYFRRQQERDQTDTYQQQSRLFQLRHGASPGAYLANLPAVSLPQEPQQGVEVPLFNEVGEQIPGRGGLPSPVTDPSSIGRYKEYEKKIAAAMTALDAEEKKPGIPPENIAAFKNAVADYVRPMAAWMNNNKPRDNTPKYMAADGQMLPITPGQWEEDKRGFFSTIDPSTGKPEFRAMPKSETDFNAPWDAAKTPQEAEAMKMADFSANRIVLDGKEYLFDRKSKSWEPVRRDDSKEDDLKSILEIQKALTTKDEDGAEQRPDFGTVLEFWQKTKNIQRTIDAIEQEQTTVDQEVEALDTASQQQSLPPDALQSVMARVKSVYGKDPPMNVRAKMNEIIVRFAQVEQPLPGFAPPPDRPVSEVGKRIAELEAEKARKKSEKEATAEKERQRLLKQALDIQEYRRLRELEEEAGLRSIGRGGP